MRIELASSVKKEAEEREEFPIQLFPHMGELEYLCLRYPAELGEGGLGKIGDCIAVSEIQQIVIARELGIR